MVVASFRGRWTLRRMSGQFAVQTLLELDGLLTEGVSLAQKLVALDFEGGALRLEGRDRGQEPADDLRGRLRQEEACGIALLKLVVGHRRG
jgi:hypothetical protein